MDRELMRAREILSENVRRELGRLRRLAEGEPYETGDLRVIADRIETALRILERVPLLTGEP